MTVVAIVAGKPFTEIPNDLFIPPDALEVLLDSFSGPLDLLLYLIRRQNLDILNIPMMMITKQYLQYIHLMKEKRLDLAADYLVMAALLAEIKSRMLLPTPVQETDEEEDPRMTLVRRLQAYEQFKNAALQLDELPRYERDVFAIQVSVNEDMTALKPHPPVSMAAIVLAMRALIQRQGHMVNHQISREPMCVRERMNHILQGLCSDKFVEFTQFFSAREGRMGLVVTVLAILELSRQSLLVIMQSNPCAAIYLKAVQNE